VGNEKATAVQPGKGLHGSAISRENPHPSGFVRTLSKAESSVGPWIFTAHHSLAYESTKSTHISCIFSMV
jgi:hypothetical protein